MPSRQPIRKAANRPVLYCGEDGRAGRPGIGQDARIGALDVLLLAQLLEAVQEALVERAVGLGLALELLELGFVLAGGADHDRRALDLGPELLLLRLGGIELGADGEVMLCVAARKRPRTEASSACACIDLGMLAGRRWSGIRRSAVEVGLLLAQRAEAGVAGDLGDVGDLVGIEAGPAERDQAAFLLDAPRLGGDVLALRSDKVWVETDAFGAAGQALVAAIGGDRLLGDLQVAAQLGQALLEPLGGTAVGLVLVVDLVGQIDLGDRVGDARRHRAVGALDRDQDDEGAAEQRDAEMARDRADRGAAAGIAVVGRCGARRRRRGCGCGCGGASSEAMPECQSSRIGASELSRKPGGLVPLNSGLVASPSRSTTRPIRNSDWMTSSSLWMAPMFSVSTPDSAASVLTALNVRVSSMMRDDALYIGVAWAMISAISATATRPAADDQRLAAIEQAQPFPQLVREPPRDARGPEHPAGRRKIRFMAPSSDLLGFRKRSHPA